jgi:protein LSM14
MSLTNNSSVKKPSSATGTTDSPYLGSKISLVSKAKIRYEGILYTIDANESTVALSKVRSFGTEDRPTDRPVPARDEIFEYIIFRGADIEDLQVREPPSSSLTQDPAIVESSAYSDNARSNTIGTNTNLGGLSQNGQTRSLSNRGTMPSPPHRQGAGKGSKSFEPLRQFNYNQQRSSRRYSPQSPLAQYDGQDYSYGPQRRARQQDYYNDYIPNRRNNNYAEWPRQSQRFSRQAQNYNDNRYYSSRRQQPTGRFGYRQRRNSTGGIPNNQQQQTRNNRQQRERSNGNTNRSTLKFIGDFDFEKSNAEFDKNAIEDEIKKSLSIKSNKSETSNDSPKIEQEKDKENQHITSSSTQSEQQEPNPDGYYDKQKSFFDRISCEATAKEKTNARRNWNEERRVNAETFGLKYRPIQQGGNQRSTYRRNNNNRYQRSGNGGGGGYGNRNAMYYGNFSSRVRAY